MAEKPITFAEQIALSANLQDIAKMIDAEILRVTGRKMPWSLYTWGGHRAQYVSNAPREETKLAMQECLDRWNEPQDPPPHKGFS